MKTLIAMVIAILLLGLIQSGQADGLIEDYTYNCDESIPLPNVHIRTYDSLNVLVADTVSGSSGIYIVSLPPGVYRQHFSKIGFIDRDTNSIVVADNETTHVGISFWVLSCCHYVVGDVNGSGNFTGLDVTYAVRYFKGGSHPPYSVTCPCGYSAWYAMGDVNGSCTFDGIDVVYMVRYFKGGSPPTPCPGCEPID